jgi:methyl-accepting chemotaxis protein
MIITNGVVLLGLLGATILVTLYVSHKIGGPLHRVESVLEEIGQGNLDIKIEFRQRDQLKDLVPKINHMIQNLNKRVRQIQGEVGHLQEKIQDTGWKEEEIRKDINKLHNTVNELFATEQ